METYLTIKHLAGYLPYGLQVIGKTHKEMWTLEGLNISETCELGGSSYRSDINEILPILRPLSDLTKEIEHNGEKFVPLLELAKIAFPKNRPFDDFHIKNNYVKLDKWSHQGYSFHFDIKEISFDCRVDYNEKTWRTNCYVPNQLKLIQKLYEWHFDIHGLIEKGLAIDINTLK